jgi:hypothetical protein
MILSTFVITIQYLIKLFNNWSFHLLNYSVSRKQQTKAFFYLLKIPNKIAENNWGLSLVNIRVFPAKSFSPHAKPILGTHID